MSITTRILVVEDNEDNLSLVRFLLEQAGYTVQEARNGHQAIEMAQDSPDMILLDMGIPEVDGWTVASHLKDDPRTRDLCIVALTGHILQGDRKKAIDAGCAGFISKPMDIPNFIPQVNSYLEKFKGAS